jgi:hypothetical protein
MKFPVICSIINQISFYPIKQSDTTARSSNGSVVKFEPFYMNIRETGHYLLIHYYDLYNQKLLYIHL